MIANFDINVYIIAREHLFYMFKIDRSLYGVRLISYNAGQCYIYMYVRRPAPEQYVTTQKEILKNRPVHGRLSNSPVIAKSLKSYDVSFMCYHSICKRMLIRSHTLLYVRHTSCTFQIRWHTSMYFVSYAEANLMFGHVQNVSAYASKYNTHYIHVR